MKKINVLILDKDLQYSTALCRLLQAQLTEIAFDNYSKISAIDSSGYSVSDMSIEFCGTLLIYNPAQFGDLPENAHAISLSYNKTESKESIYRYSPICDFVMLIDDYISANPDMCLTVPHKTLYCLTGRLCRDKASAEVLQLAKSVASDGFIPVLVDLCPRYECVFPPNSAGSGLGLSDAMLSIIADNLAYESLGIYLYPVSAGILNFRPFECTDDIFECNPEIIRKFVSMLRLWNEKSGNRHCIILVLRYIPFSFLYRAAVLCDSLIVYSGACTLVDNGEFAREMSYLSANLPDSCELRHMDLSGAFTGDYSVCD